MRKSILILPSLVLIVAILVFWTRRFAPADSGSAVPGVDTTRSPVQAKPLGEAEGRGASGVPNQAPGQRAQPAQTTGPAPAPNGQSNGRTKADLSESAL